MTLRVAGPGGAVDLAVPAELPVVDLVCQLVDRLAAGAPLGDPGDVWVLHRLDGRALPASQSVDGAQVLDGETLHLTRAAPPPASVRVDDPLQVLADAARLAPRWDPRAVEVAAAVAVGLAAVVAVGLSLLVPFAGPALPLLLGGGLLAGALALSSSGSGAAAAATAAAAGAVVALGAAGLAAAAGRPAAATLTAATLAGVALGGCAAGAVLPARVRWWVAVAAGAGTGALALGLVGTQVVAAAAAAGVTAVAWLVLLAALPWLVARRAPWRRPDAPAAGTVGALSAAAVRTRRVLDGVAVGGAVAVAAAGGYLALVGDGLAQGLAAALAVVVAARARRSAFLVDSAAQLLAGGLVGAALAARLATGGGTTARLAVLAAVALLCVAALVVAVQAGRAAALGDPAGAAGGVTGWWSQPRTRRLVDVVEYAAALAVLPLLLGVLGVYTLAADAGARL